MATYRETPEYKKIKIDEAAENLLYGYLSIETAFSLKWLQAGPDVTPDILVGRIMQFVPAKLDELFAPPPICGPSR
jgi:hypothetical protein